MIRNRITAVFRVTDAVTGEAVGKNMVSLYVNGNRAETIYKAGGYLLAMNMEEGTADFEFRSPYYQLDRLSRNVRGTASEEDVVPVMLQPGENYPRMHELTRAVGRLCTEKGSLEGFEVIILYNSGEKFKLAQESIKKNSTSVKLYSSGSNDNAGKAFVIQDKEGGNEDYCRIIKGPDEDGICIFEKAFEFNHKRGDNLRKAVKVFPDKKGTFLFALSDYDSEDTETEIIVLSSGKVTCRSKLNLIKGKLNDIGVISTL